MSKTSFSRELFSLVLPMAAQSLLTSIVSASDAVMLGALNQASLSAVSLAAQIHFVFSLLIAAVTIGTSVLAAQYWGKGDRSTVEDVLGIGFRYSALAASLFFVMTALCPELLMKAFTDDTELILLGAEYLRIVSVSYLIQGITQIYLCIMKNSGRTARSTVFASVAVILNFIMNWLLIFGIGIFPKMEIRGAALATVIAQAVVLLLVMIENLKKDVVRFRFSKLIKKAGKLEKEFLRFTFPVLGNEIAWGVGVTMFSVILGHMGSDAVAANSIASIVKSVIACVCTGIGGGAGIMIGNRLGKGDLEEARICGDRLARAALLGGLVSGVLILLGRPLIMLLASNLTEETKALLQNMLLICSYYIIGKSINGTTIGGIFCAGGDTKFGFICDTVTLWCICIPLGSLAAFILKWPVLPVYFILNLDEMVKLPAVYRHYKKYQWIRNLTKEENEHDNA